MKTTPEELEKELNIRIIRGGYNNDVPNYEYFYDFIDEDKYDEYNNEKNKSLRENDFDCYERLYDKYNVRRESIDNLNNMYVIAKRNRKINELLDES